MSTLFRVSVQDTNSNIVAYLLKITKTYAVDSTWLGHYKVRTVIIFSEQKSSVLNSDSFRLKWWSLFVSCTFFIVFIFSDRFSPIFWNDQRIFRHVHKYFQINFASFWRITLLFDQIIIYFQNYQRKLVHFILLWRVEICKLALVWRWFRNSE